jgi:hemolysin D
MSQELSPKSPTLQITIFVTLIAFVSLLIFSIVMKIEVVAQGQGKFIPQTRAQIIQPEYAGSILEIPVRNGDFVEKGQLLLQLDPTNIQAELAAIEYDIERLGFERDRIRTALDFASKVDQRDTTPEEILTIYQSQYSEASNDEILLSQSILLEAEVRAFQSNLGRLNAEIEVAIQSQDLASIRLDQSLESLTIQQERFETASNLREQGVATQTTYLEELDQRNRLQSEVELNRKEVEQSQTQLTALQKEKESYIGDLINTYTQNLNKTISELATLEQEQIVANRQLIATRIISPADGIVDQLDVHTIGGVVDAGQEVLRIVPQSDDLIVEAMFSNENIAFMRVGQKANISIDAYPSQRFGYVDGSVSYISADAIKVEENQWGFVVHIKPENLYLEIGDNQVPLSAGMSTNTDIITEKRRIISYFFAPIIDTLQNSLGER